MKNYEEMARDVLQRRDAYLLRQKIRRRIAGGCFGGVCVAVALSIGVWVSERSWDNPNGPILDDPYLFETLPTNQMPTQTDTAKEKADDGFMLLLLSEPGAEGTALENNLAMPLNYRLTVTDIRGLDESAVKMLSEQQVQQNEKTLKKYRLDHVPAWMHYNTLRRDNFLISLVRIGTFQLYIEDYSMVDCIQIHNATAYGQTDIFFSAQNYYRGNDLTLTPEQIPENVKQGGLCINWKYSNVVLDALEEDPTANLAIFSDTVTFTVSYKNGVERSCKVDIMIHEDGSVYAIQKEANIVA